MTVGEKIRKFRIDQGIYTERIGNHVRIGANRQLRNYELGNRFPSSRTIRKNSKLN